MGLENYAVYRKDREGKGGGVMIMVEDKLKSKRKLLTRNRAEIMAIEMEDGVGKKAACSGHILPTTD